MGEWANSLIDLVLAIFFLVLGIDFIQHWKALGKKMARSEVQLRKFFGAREPSEEYDLFAGRIVFFAGILAITFSMVCLFQLIFRIWR